MSAATVDPRVEALLAQDQKLARAKIISETAKIPWPELQRFFAAGKVMHVTRGLDLVDVAHAMQQDDLARVESWISNANMASVDKDQARAWFEADASLWAVVVKPWVLVQEIDSGPDPALSND